MIWTALSTPHRTAGGVLAALVLLGAGCTTDFSGTREPCGDGAFQDDESCDDGNTSSGDGCSASCQVEDGWTCLGQPSQCEPECGDGLARGTEACDGTDLGNLSCSDLGLGSGTLACYAACVFDTSDCDLPSVCGNGVVESLEDCDGDDLRGSSCEDLGLDAGTLTCTPDCEFDVSQCSAAATCGNGFIEYPELCDGATLNGQSCTDQGFYGGALGCNLDCLGYDTSQCTGFCGDGTVNGSEACDGTDPGGATCASLGCHSGQPACNADCTFDLTPCEAGHDEDGDGVDDSCDNCPTYANAPQVNTDDDQVGDACEAPWGMSALSTIEVFDPLLSTAGTWTVHSGTWTPVSDAVTGSGVAGGNYLHPLALANVSYSVETTFHLASSSPVGNNWTGLVFAFTEQTGNIYSYECAYERNAATLGIWRAAAGPWLGLDAVAITTTVQASQWHRLRAYYDGSTVTCTYDDETGATAQTQVTGSDVWADMSGSVGLRVYNETATFTSFVVYQ